MATIYKIRHIKTGKFIRVKLELEGIACWVRHDVIETGKFGKVLFDTHKGWAMPPNPSNEDFAKIGCEIVKYTITEKEC